MDSFSLSPTANQGLEREPKESGISSWFIFAVGHLFDSPNRKDDRESGIE